MSKSLTKEGVGSSSNVFEKTPAGSVQQIVARIGCPANGLILIE
jgi:hypothetical protein